MIPKNLKVGDKFTEGNSTYEVLEIVPQGYVSKRVAIGPAKGYTVETPKVDEPKASVKDAQLDSFNTYTKTEINRLNNTELEKVCDELGLEKSTGIAMKKNIIDHLGL